MLISMIAFVIGLVKVLFVPVQPVIGIAANFSSLLSLIISFVPIILILAVLGMIVERLSKKKG